MKIVKEVLIKATKADIWLWLTEDKALRKLFNFGSGSKVVRLETPLLASKTGRIHTEPPNKISSCAGNMPTIVTTLELLEQGKRTRLKVTISGWETVDSETARIEMPKISLAWEKKLNRLKKAIESETQKRVQT
jgi:hypothetical protein